MGLTKATQQNTTQSHRMDPERLQVLKQSIRGKRKNNNFFPSRFLLVYKTLAYLHFWVKLPGPPGKPLGKQVFCGAQSNVLAWWFPFISQLSMWGLL